MVLTLFLLFNAMQTQANTIDSCYVLLANKSKLDSNKINLIIEIARLEQKRDSIERSLKLLNYASKLSIELKDSIKIYIIYKKRYEEFFRLF